MFLGFFLSREKLHIPYVFSEDSLYEEYSLLMFSFDLFFVLFHVELSVSVIFCMMFSVEHFTYHNFVIVWYLGYCGHRRISSG